MFIHESINFLREISTNLIHFYEGFVTKKNSVAKKRDPNVDSVLKITIENDSLPIAFKHESYT